MICTKVVVVSMYTVLKEFKPLGDLWLDVWYIISFVTDL